MTMLKWKTGFEIEMIAPAGSTRRDLAEALTAANGGTVRRVFHAQSEPSKVPGVPIFENLTLAFDAFDRDGAPIARCADDLTIVADLDRHAPPRPGWYRIVSDDARFLRLVIAQCDAEATQAAVLQPMADLFGTKLDADADGMVRLSDAMAQSVAIATGLPNERERPCELITPPICSQHRTRLADLLETARRLGFTVPREAAVHVHFDAERLRNARTLTRLVNVLHRHGTALRELVGTNPHCVRLAPMDVDIVETVASHGFLDLAWPEVQQRFKDVPLTKYCDFNLMNTIRDVPGKETFEVRIFPGSMDVEEIVRGARLFEAILEWCVDAPRQATIAEPLPELLAGLTLSDDERDFYRQMQFLDRS